MNPTASRWAVITSSTWRTTGERSSGSTSKTGAVRAIAHGAPLVNPTGLEKGPDGKLYTTDYGAGPGSTGAVFRVNPKNGNVALVRQRTAAR